MADVGVCNASGCFGRCPTSTICGRRPECPPENPCPPGCYIQREGCGCGCRLPAPEKCPRAHKNKDYINMIAEDFHYFQHFYKLVRTMPRLRNKPCQMPKGPDGKPIMKNKRRDSTRKGGKFDSGEGDTEKSDKRGGIFDVGSDDSDDSFNGQDGDGGGGGHSRRGPPLSKEAQMRNKLNMVFDEALKNGFLDNMSENKKLTPGYIRDVLGINVKCIKTCEPLCCAEETTQS